MRKVLLTAAAAVMLTSPAMAVPFDFIRIGDVDGFGWSTSTGGSGTVGLTAANGGAADTNGNGLLEQTEYLPDINTNGSVATGAGDDWDNRSAAEIGDIGPLGGSGYTNGSSSGFKWTDITLSTSFSSATNFPDSGGIAAPNEPVFVFDFNVAGGDIVPGSTIFFNLIFGDYDVTPADIDLTFASEPGRTVALTTQGGGEDGLIQAATATLTFSEVFTADGGGGWDGFVQVDFNAPNEPYTAFDFAELSLDQIPFTTVPEPSSMILFGSALVAFGWYRRSRS